MSEDNPPSGAPPVADVTADDFARDLGLPGGLPGPVPMPTKGELRNKLLLAVLVGAIGIGASVMSCVGQSFTYRQAKALEGIEQQLKIIRASCSSTKAAQP